MTVAQRCEGEGGKAESIILMYYCIVVTWLQFIFQSLLEPLLYVPTTKEGVPCIQEEVIIPSTDGNASVSQMIGGPLKRRRFRLNICNCFGSSPCHQTPQGHCHWVTWYSLSSILMVRYSWISIVCNEISRQYPQRKFIDDLPDEVAVSPTADFIQPFALLKKWGIRMDGLHSKKRLLRK